MSLLGVALIIPCFNEEAAIGSLIGEVVQQGITTVIVVDGGSSDATAARARAAGALVVVEPRRGYGRACATGAAHVLPGTQIVAFIDGDGSDDPVHLARIIGPLQRDEADFVMGSRLHGTREPGSLSLQQIVAGHVAGRLLRLCYGARFTDMSPYRALRLSTLNQLGMSEMTYGWNLEMQMRVAALRLRMIEVPVGCRIRRGGVSKVSGNAAVIAKATWSIASTFLRLALKSP